MPNLCEEHFQLLRTKTKEAGLFGTSVDAVSTGMRLILTKSVDMWPPLVLEPETCCICFFNTKRSDDGRCLCTNEGCSAQEPGSVEPFETWIDKAVAGVKEFIETEGGASYAEPDNPFQRSKP